METLFATDGNQTKTSDDWSMYVEWIHKGQKAEENTQHNRNEGKEWKALKEMEEEVEKYLKSFKPRC